MDDSIAWNERNGHAHTQQTKKNPRLQSSSKFLFASISIEFCTTITLGSSFLALFHSEWMGEQIVCIAFTFLLGWCMCVYYSPCSLINIRWPIGIFFRFVLLYRSYMHLPSTMRVQFLETLKIRINDSHMNSKRVNDVWPLTSHKSQTDHYFNLFSTTQRRAKTNVASWFWLLCSYIYVCVCGCFFSHLFCCSLLHRYCSCVQQFDHANANIIHCLLKPFRDATNVKFVIPPLGKRWQSLGHQQKEQTRSNRKKRMKKRCTIKYRVWEGRRKEKQS